MPENPNVIDPPIKTVRPIPNGPAAGPAPDFAWDLPPHGSRFRFEVVTRSLENGRVLVFTRHLKGALAEGATLPEALEALRGVLREVLAVYGERGTLPRLVDRPLDEGDRPCGSVVVDA